MKKLISMGNEDLHCKNRCKLDFLMKSSKLEDPYRIRFHRSVWPEVPWEIHFFKKCCSKQFPLGKCMFFWKLRWNGSRIDNSGWESVRMKRFTSTKPPRPLPTPKTLTKTSKLEKMFEKTSVVFGAIFSHIYPSFMGLHFPFLSLVLTKKWKRRRQRQLLSRSTSNDKTLHSIMLSFQHTPNPNLLPWIWWLDPGPEVGVGGVF